MGQPATVASAKVTARRCETDRRHWRGDRSAGEGNRRQSEVEHAPM